MELVKQWKNYDHVKTDTLWEFPSRLKEGGHSNEYHGNYIPQIAQQIYERYTKKGDVVYLRNPPKCDIMSLVRKEFEANEAENLSAFA